MKKTRYECLGGPLCGKLEAAVKSEIGIPAFAYDDDKGVSHFYRLAKSATGHYWHYLGTRGIDMEIRPYMRPMKNDG